MKINELYMKDFRGIPEARLELGEFSCLIGHNGAGKTTILEAICLLCSSLEFSDEKGVPSEGRLRAFLSRNIRNEGEPGGATSFLLSSKMEHEGREYEVVLTENGFQRNDILGQDWWTPILTYFARFDSEMSSFLMPIGHWKAFKGYYEGIFGVPIEPEIYEDDELAGTGMGTKVVTGFYLCKGGGRVPCRRGSAGEKKVAKVLSQVICLPANRLPHVVLVDNMEMHVHHERHLQMFDVVKRMFSGMQVIATTHSTVIMEKYEPKNEIIDVERIVEGRKRGEQI